MHENLLLCIAFSKELITFICQGSEKDDLYMSFRYSPKIYKTALNPSGPQTKNEFWGTFHLTALWPYPIERSSRFFYSSSPMYRRGTWNPRSYHQRLKKCNLRILIPLSFVFSRAHPSLTSFLIKQAKSAFTFL